MSTHTAIAPAPRGRNPFDSSGIERTPEGIARYVDRLGGSWINRLFMKLTFRWMLLPRAWRPDAFAAMLKRIAFRRTEIIPNAIGMEIWLDA